MKKKPGILDEYGLLNDSIFALRKFSGIFDNLEHQNVHMTSLAYSYTYKWNKGFGPEEFWVESVYRGLDQTGMDIFNEHSCVAEDHPFFCSDDPEMTKACTSILCLSLFYPSFLFLSHIFLSLGIHRHVLLTTSNTTLPKNILVIRYRVYIQQIHQTYYCLVNLGRQHGLRILDIGGCLSTKWVSLLPRQTSPK